MFTLHKMKSLSVRPLYSDSISTITKDEQLKSFSLSCHKENTSESWSKATAAQPFILKKKTKTEQFFAGLLFRNQLKPHWIRFVGTKYLIRGQEQNQHTLTQNWNSRFISPAHNNAIATGCPSTASWQTKKMAVLQESLQRRIFYPENKHSSCHTLLCKALLFENRLSLFSDGLILSGVVLTSSGWVRTCQ